jgi:hypothetical protein
MSLSATTFKIHRWLGWLVGAQVLVWVIGGVVFSIVPFQDWVKGGAAVTPPVASLPAQAFDRLAPALREQAGADMVAGLAVVATPHGPGVRLSFLGGRPAVILRADGSPLPDPDAAQVRRFAAGLYRGSASITAVERLAAVPSRLGIVAETGGRGDLWRVQFDDGLGTRIYLKGSTGEFVAVRNEAWVWYDFFWRLHIMDYADGEDFNGTLLRAASLSAIGLVLAGAVLAVLAARRRWRSWRRPTRS